MKNIFTVLLVLSFIAFSGFVISNNYGKKCSPKGQCSACKNCTGCKNCAKDGGTCSICK